MSVVKEIIVDENNVNYKSIDVLYDKEMKTFGISGIEEGIVLVPQGTVGIGCFLQIKICKLFCPIVCMEFHCFIGTQNLNEIYIPDGVEEFGNEVFMNSNLEYVHMSHTSQLKNVDGVYFMTVKN